MMDDAKRYLLRVLLGIRQVDISICGLYSYALYARALGEYNDSGLLPILKEKSWIPVFSENLQTIRKEKWHLRRWMIRERY